MSRNHSLTFAPDKHRSEIDGLRAIAVLAVIINHISKTALPNGHLGVDIFYVISGFVITQSLLSRQHISFGHFILGFYERRIKRLVPALFLCIAVTIISILLILSPESPLAKPSLRTGMAAFFGLSNLYLLRQATDYFGASAELNPFTHTWSLGVEEQFYFIFPVLLWLSGLPQNKSGGLKKFVWMVGLTALVSLLGNVWLSKINPVMAFYLMPTRFWELALGVGTYLALMRSPTTPQILRNLAVQITLPALLALFVLFFIPLPMSNNGLTTFGVVAITAVLIAGIRPQSLVYRLLTWKPLVFLGLISYSLYLWHWNVLTISRWTIGVTPRSLPLQLATIFLLAILSYRFVERPLRQADWGRGEIGSLKPRIIGQTLAISLGLTFLVFFVASPLQKRGTLYLGASAPLIKKGVETLLDDHTYNNFSWVAKRCILSSNDDIGKVIRQENCTFGDFATAQRRFLVIGNSFSAAEIELYQILVAKERGAVTVTSSWGASAVPEVENTSPWSQANAYYWNSVIPTLLNELRKGDVVIMINDGGDFSPKKHNTASEQRIRTLQKGLERLAEETAKRGIFIIYQSSIPFLRESNCTPDTAMPQWWNVAPPCTYYTRKESLERRRMYHESLLAIQSRFKNFAVLDLFDVFCPHEVCRLYRDKETFLYRDESSHPSVEANILAQPLLLATVDKLTAENTSPLAEKF